MLAQLSRWSLVLALAVSTGYLVSDAALLAQDTEKGGKGKFEKGKGKFEGKGKFGKGAPDAKKEGDVISELKARIAELEEKLKTMMAAKDTKAPPAKGDKKEFPKFDFKGGKGGPPFGPGFGGKGGPGFPPFGPGFGGKDGFPPIDPKAAEKFKEFSEKFKKLRDEYFPPKADLKKDTAKVDLPGRGKGGPPMGFGRGGFGKIEPGSPADVSRRLDRIAAEIDELRKMMKSK